MKKIRKDRRIEGERESIFRPLYSKEGWERCFGGDKILKIGVWISNGGVGGMFCSFFSFSNKNNQLSGNLFYQPRSVLPLTTGPLF